MARMLPAAPQAMAKGAVRRVRRLPCAKLAEALTRRSTPGGKPPA